MAAINRLMERNRDAPQVSMDDFNELRHRHNDLSARHQRLQSHFAQLRSQARALAARNDELEDELHRINTLYEEADIERRLAEAVLDDVRADHARAKRRRTERYRDLAAAGFPVDVSTEPDRPDEILVPATPSPRDD
jgi:chromosome segregation ATPase